MKLIIYIAAAALSGCAGSPLHNAVSGNGFKCTMDDCLSPAQQLDARLVVDNSPNRLRDQLTQVTTKSYSWYCSNQDLKAEATRYNIEATTEDWSIVGAQLAYKVRLLCEQDDQRKSKFVGECTTKLMDRINLVHATQRKHSVWVTPTSLLLSNTHSCGIIGY